MIINPLAPLYDNNNFNIHNEAFITDLLDSIYTAEEIAEHGYDFTQRIKISQLSYVVLGVYYYCIKANKLYYRYNRPQTINSKHKISKGGGAYITFKQYAEEALGISVYTAMNYMKAAKITLTLTSMGCERLPKYVSHALVLSKLPSDKLLSGWNEICEIYNDCEMTKDKIEQALFPFELGKSLPTTTINLSASTYEKLVIGAMEVRMNINQYVEALLPPHLQ